MQEHGSTQPRVIVQPRRPERVATGEPPGNGALGAFVRSGGSLSAVTVQYPAGEARFAGDFKAAEDVVKGCGLDWTLLRCADFAANALAWAPRIRHAGVVRGACGPGGGSQPGRPPEMTSNGRPGHARRGPSERCLRPVVGPACTPRCPECDTSQGAVCGGQGEVQSCLG